jgi:hypothetical protein
VGIYYKYNWLQIRVLVLDLTVWATIITENLLLNSYLNHSLLERIDFGIVRIQVCDSGSTRTVLTSKIEILALRPRLIEFEGKNHRRYDMKYIKFALILYGTNS